MKYIIILILLPIATPIPCQPYTSASIGLGLAQGWNGVERQQQFGIRDYYVSFPFGYHTQGLLLEVQPSY